MTTTACTFPPLHQDRLNSELEELDYELRMEGLVEMASSHMRRSGLELHHAAAEGQLENVRFLVKKKLNNPMQRGESTALHIAVIVGSMEYFVTECNCNPACPGPLGLMPLHLASEQGHLDVVKYLVIEQQIDPLCEDQNGNTPLHTSACWQVVIMQLLSCLLHSFKNTLQSHNLLGISKTNGTVLLFTLQH